MGQLLNASVLFTDLVGSTALSSSVSPEKADAQWAKTAVTVGDHATAEVMRERLLPIRDQIICTGITVCPVAGHYIGRLEHLLGRHDDADASFARAHEMHQRVRAAQFVARTEVRWAQLLRDRNQPGDHTRARDLARAARDGRRVGRVRGRSSAPRILSQLLDRVSHLAAGLSAMPAKPVQRRRSCSSKAAASMAARRV